MSYGVLPVAHSARYAGVAWHSHARDLSLSPWKEAEPSNSDACARAFILRIGIACPTPYRKPGGLLMTLARGVESPASKYAPNTHRRLTTTLGKHPKPPRARDRHAARAPGARPMMLMPQICSRHHLGGYASAHANANVTQNTVTTNETPTRRRLTLHTSSPTVIRRNGKRTTAQCRG